MKNSIFVLPLLAAVVLSTTSCVEKGTVRIDGAVSTYEDFFVDDCPDPLDSSPLTVGRLDVSEPARNSGYTSLLRVAMQNANLDPANAKEVHVYFTDETGEALEGVDVPGPGDPPNVFGAGGVIKYSGSIVVAPLLTAADVSQLAIRVQNTSLRILANIKIWATLESGYPVDSFIYTLPIDLCRGCLFNVGVTDASLTLPNEQKVCVDNTKDYLENEGVQNGCSFSNQEGPQRYCQ